MNDMDEPPIFLSLLFSLLPFLWGFFVLAPVYGKQL